MKIFWVLSIFLLTACGSDEVTVSERPEVSYATIQPAAGMSYQDFRSLHEWGEGDMRDAQKRFISLDHDNNGRLTPNELSH